MPARVASSAALTPLSEALARALLVPAAPLMRMQGRRVRREALRLPEAPGPREGWPPPQSSASARRRLLIIGDSSAAGVGVADQSLALSGQLLKALAGAGASAGYWRLIARTGITAGQLPALVDQHLSAQVSQTERFDLAVIAVGVNDVTGATPLARWRLDLDRLQDRIRRLGITHAIYSGVPPMDRFTALPQPLRSWMGLQARRYDRALAEWAVSQPDVTHLAVARLDDPALLADDGFHPGEAGCALWARELSRVLAPLLQGA